jgi:type VI secretion system protein ImpC
MAATMRAVLMSQPLRTLERAWRSVEWLMQRLDNEAVEIHVVDLSKASLSAHLSENAEHLDRSALHRLFCEPSSDNSWDLFVGDYSFALDEGDLLLLTTLGAIAGQAGAPFLAHGDLSLCGCQSLEQLDSPWDWQLPDDEVGQLWAEVRSHPAAQSVGLATPRIMLRQPYGPVTDPIDTFDFHELPPRPEPELFLWGNPAIGCAYLLGRAHADELDFSGTGDLEIEDLPAVLYNNGTGQALQPPVEALISERAMTQIQAAGLIPILGRRDSNSVRCTDLTAVASTTTSFLV